MQQHAVARGLVQLDVVGGRQQVLERRAVVSRRAAHQRHAGGVQAEFIILQGLHRRQPVHAGRQVIREPRRAKLVRNHLVDAQHAEVLRDDRVLGDFTPNGQRNLDGAHDQFVSLKLHLPARDIQRRDDLRVGRCGRVDEHGLVKRRNVVLVVFIAHGH
ncbi:hypothetical protein D3C87_1619040 [compost metagenome]